MYPVKACRGVKVKSARVTNTGFELDRAFCVVDTKGNVVWKGEAISQRALPVLATIDVALSASGDELTLSALKRFLTLTLTLTLTLSSTKRCWGLLAD